MPRRTLHMPADKAVSVKQVTQVLEKAHPVTIILSQMGWIRAMKGHNIDPSSLSFKSGDKSAITLECQSTQPIVILGDKGRVFNVMPSELPGGKTQGEPISSKVIFQDGEKPAYLMAYEEGKSVLLINDNGHGFVTPMDNMLTRAKKGKPVMVMKSGSIMPPVIYEGQPEHLALTSHRGRLVIIPTKDINESNKSQGIRLINLDKQDDRVTSAQHLNCDSEFTLMVGRRKFVMPPEKWAKYVCARARKGMYFEGGRQQLSLLD